LEAGQVKAQIKKAQIKKAQIKKAQIKKVQIKRQVKRARNAFAGITVFTAVFSAIYEYFSHGVYSGFMIWAALIPFFGVVLPYTVWLKTNASGTTSPDPEMSANASTRMQIPEGEEEITAESQEKLQEKSPEGSYAESQDGSPACSVYQSAVLTFLLGSVFTGILEIYGTTNRLSKVYWIVGGGLLAVSICLKVAVRNAKAEG